MLFEQWEKWEPLPHLEKQYQLVSVRMEPYALEIIVQSVVNPMNKKIRFFWDEEPDAYRKSENAYRLQLLSSLARRYSGTLDLSGSFFTVQESLFMLWLLKDEDKVKNTYKNHWVIITSYHVIEVISRCDPEVTLV
jgi:hypothetical protein